MLKQILSESASENESGIKYPMREYGECECIMHTSTTEIGWKLSDKRALMRKISRKDKDLRTIISRG